MHNEVRVSVHACMNDYLRCTKCEVHDRVCKNVIRFTKKRVPRFLILEPQLWQNINLLFLHVNDNFKLFCLRFQGLNVDCSNLCILATTSFCAFCICDHVNFFFLDLETVIFLSIS